MRLNLRPGPLAWLCTDRSYSSQRMKTHFSFQPILNWVIYQPCNLESKEIKKLVNCFCDQPAGKTKPLIGYLNLNEVVTSRKEFKNTGDAPKFQHTTEEPHCCNSCCNTSKVVSFFPVKIQMWSMLEHSSFLFWWLFLSLPELFCSPQTIVL